MADKNKITFSKLNTIKKREFSYKESNRDTKYIKNGADNNFPQDLIDLYNRSSVHAAAVNAIVQGVIGDGLTANEEMYLERANSHGESWNDIFKKIAIDYKLHGSYAMEVIYSKDRSRLEVYHVDFSLLRAAEKNHRGHIPGYFISTEWDKNRMGIVKDEDIDYLPIYNPIKKDIEPNQIFVYKAYRPGQEYYPLPDYVAALRITDLDTSIDDFHSANIKNGLAPSLAITTFTNGSDDQIRAIEDQLNANYGGTENAGSLVFMDVASQDEAPIITPIQQNTSDTYYTTINDMVTQKILTAHRITSPLLLGIQQPGSLGNRDEMLNAYALFQANVVRPYQQQLLTSLEFLIQYNYPDAVLGIDQRTLLDDGDVEEEVVVDQETTVDEVEEIEQPETLA